MDTHLTAAKIESEFKSIGLHLALGSDPSQEILRLSPVEDCTSSDLVFVDKKTHAAALATRRPAAVIASKSLQNELQALQGVCILYADNVALAHAFIKQKYFSRDYQRSCWSAVEKGSHVHETANVHALAVVEPGAVVGARASIGARTRIMAGAVIEHDSQIGADCVIHPNAVVGYSVRIGNETSIGSGTVLGSEGYGFAQDQARKSHAIPQTGTVVIGDRVRVGACCCVDRATYRETRIGNGTKIDNLCHIAHNVKIGEDCLLTAMLCVAGSTVIGDRVITSGQTGIIDHLNIGNDVVFLHKAGVTKDVVEPGAYAGTPAQPLAEYFRATAAIRLSADLRKRIAVIEQKLGIDQSSST